jgi:rhomboid protease GluP
LFRHTLIPVRRFPQLFPVVTGIILVQIVVFLMYALSGKGVGPATWVQFGAFVQWRIQDGEYWRLVSSLFLHVHLLQLLMMGVSLYLFAPQLEWLFGKLSFLFIYLCAGIAGYWGIYLTDVDGVITGANEAIYGLLGVYLFLALRGMIHPVMGRMVLVFVVINLAFGWNLLFGHIVALTTGFVLAMIFIQFKSMQSDQDEEDDWQ